MRLLACCESHENGHNFCVISQHGLWSVRLKGLFWHILLRSNCLKWHAVAKWITHVSLLRNYTNKACHLCQIAVSARMHASPERGTFVQVCRCGLCVKMSIRRVTVGTLRQPAWQIHAKAELASQRMTCSANFTHGLRMHAPSVRGTFACHLFPWVHVSFMRHLG